MKIVFSIKLNLQNGETRTFKDDAGIHFEFQQWGTFFVEGGMEVKKKQRGLILDEVQYRNVRTWIPISTIKDVEVITWKTINDREEIRKYEKFLEHGIDIMVTKISHTNPPDKNQIEEVEKKIAKEDKAKKERQN